MKQQQKQKNLCLSVNLFSRIFHLLLYFILSLSSTLSTNFYSLSLFLISTFYLLLYHIQFSVSPSTLSINFYSLCITFYSLYHRILSLKFSILSSTTFIIFCSHFCICVLILNLFPSLFLYLCQRL